MNKIKVFIVIAIFALLTIGIYKVVQFVERMEVNTVSPQVSSSITESKRKNLFKQSYRLDSVTSSNELNINEAWIEDVWKNSFQNGKKYKEKFGSGVQLAINTSGFKKYGYEDEAFLIDWIIQTDKQELQGGGRGNGLYIFYLKDTIPPEKIKLTLVDKSIQSNRRKQITFELKK